MNFHHLLYIGLMALGFSAMPAPKRNAPVPIVAPHSDTAIFVREVDAEFIPWTASKLLDWEDFQSMPRRGTDAVASTSTSLGIAYQIVNGDLTYHITCSFSRLKSWGLMKTDYILAHEQGHFDITEIYARRLHEALANYQYNRGTFKKDIAEIYNRIVDAKEAAQHRYDADTDHSRNRKQQYDWLERIQQELDETEVWGSYP